MDVYRHAVYKLKQLMQGEHLDALQGDGYEIRLLAKDLSPEEQHLLAIIGASLDLSNKGVRNMLTNIDILTALRILRDNAVAEGRREALAPSVRHDIHEEFRP